MVVYSPNFVQKRNPPFNGRKNRADMAEGKQRGGDGDGDGYAHSDGSIALVTKSTSLFAYCSGFTVEISASAPYFTVFAALAVFFFTP